MNTSSFLHTMGWCKGRQVKEQGFFHLLLGQLLHRRDCLPQPWKRGEGDEEKEPESYLLLAAQHLLSTGHSRGCSS